GAAELAQLHAWGTGAPLAPPSALVPAQIAAHAAATPDAIAVVCGDASLTYGALVTEANRLARRLRAAGVARGQAVPVLIERSVQTIVAITGVHAAGAGYVPLDPTQPPERIAAVLRELAAPVIVVPGAIEVPAGAPPTIRVGELGDVAEDLANDVALEPAAAGDLAYIIYTSGSTGVPKGVAIDHGNLAASNAARAAYYGAELKPRFLVLSSFAFDSSVAGLFWSLAQGGTLVLPTEAAHLDVPRLAGLIERHAATHVLTLPSVYALLVDHAPVLGSLCAAIVAGEACPAELIHHHHARLPGVKLYNEYGPTEATVWASVHELVPDDGDGRVPIGRPIPGARLYVLDGELRPVPAGVVGDLWIGGPGVAVGYVARPELTAAAFRPDPWLGGAARMYRTGDRVRFRGDGALEFWGRHDHQVKIRGFRIELEEIEAALRRHPRIADAAVAVHGAAPAQVLAAHVVARDPGEGLAGDVRAWLGRSLPAYMVPSVLAVVDALPRTATGKLDRGALKPPAAAAPASFVAASTAVQRTVIEIWKQVLGVERIGVDDNFFELGGQSFLVMQVHAKLSQALARELPVVALFQYPTVRALAGFLDDAGDAARGDGGGRQAARRRLLRRGERVRPRDGG
ncbi:MAG TPA: amino acid adenylation domain-containing protein, partial [Kofleriaceae bacterium]|nr:amino acid adenylation domain-containing protein [Kofleriaceae bacterium]